MQRPAFPGVADQRGKAVKPVNELTIGHGDKEREYEAEMDGQEQPHRRPAAERKQRQTGEACEKQHRDESDVHAEPGLVEHVRIAREFRREQAGGTDEEAHAADGSEDDRQFVPGVRCLATDIVVDARGRCRGEAKKEPVEGEVMIEAAAVGRALILVEAAHLAAFEIAQAEGIAHCVDERA
jgi:hypothetical protein